MEAEWQADRSSLRELIRSRPDLSLKQMAMRIGRSYCWVKKWARRLATAPPDDLTILYSRSRARKTPPPGWDPLVLRCIEHIRQFPQRACSASLAQKRSSTIYPETTHSESSTAPPTLDAHGLEIAQAPGFVRSRSPQKAAPGAAAGTARRGSSRL